MTKRGKTAELSLEMCWKFWYVGEGCQGGERALGFVQRKDYAGRTNDFPTSRRGAFLFFHPSHAGL
jgi:hypothetical protein